MSSQGENMWVATVEEETYGVNWILNREDFITILKFILQRNTQILQHKILIDGSSEDRAVWRYPLVQNHNAKTLMKSVNF